MRLALAALAAALAAAPTDARSFPSPPTVMPWLCLQRCNDTVPAIEAQLAQIAANASTLNVASFEMFNLGPGSTLVFNSNLYPVADPLAAEGVATLAMVSSYPYPPNFILYMRAVFAKPGPFISACIAAAAKYRLSGFNIDWEPSNPVSPITPADAAAYAAFLDTLATALHGHGLKVTVDVAGWSPIWNLTAIAATSVDQVMTMDTYTDDWTSFQASLARAVAVIPPEKLVIGLETTKASNGQPYSDAELAQRFGALAAAGVRKVGLWRAPVPDNWWPFLTAL